MVRLNRDVLEGFPSKDPVNQVHGEGASALTGEKRSENCDAGWMAVWVPDKVPTEVVKVSWRCDSSVGLEYCRQV